MQIKTLTLYVKNLEKQKTFYKETLKLPIVEEVKEKFSVIIGTTKLIFKKDAKNYKYHYCFLIPSNKFDEAVIWLNNNLDIVTINEEQETQFFESWNAQSVYFYDGNENLVEFIARYDLKNDVETPFNASQIISVSEIGMPSNNKIEELNQKLETDTNSKFWKGNFNRFGTNGDQNGLFLLVNNAIKKEWFPTNIYPESSPFKALIQVNEKDYYIEFKNEKLKIQ